ncbi:hypothetical protein [Klebsiella quasipneumoniae]|uniref:hypothetical protein n=1 Tax=Klebsiella quasipneumoniae TaxID=1463165 RepID=UPI00388DCCB1
MHINNSIICAAITQLTRDIAENNANTTQKSISSIGTTASGPVLELSDSAQDVLYALFRGALVSGDIPSKLAPPHCVLWDLPRPAIQPRHTKGRLFHWLTPAGYAFAIGYLVNTRFGKHPANAIASGQPSVHPEGLSIHKAMIKGAIRSAAHVCGNTIEQETLSKVLANSLHNVSHEKAGDVAEQLAGPLSLRLVRWECIQ